MEKITLETKVQTIYFETETGELEKYHHIHSERMTMKEAEETLESKGINFLIVLRVLTEKVEIELDIETVEQNIVGSKRYYQQTKEQQ